MRALKSALQNHPLRVKALRDGSVPAPDRARFPDVPRTRGLLRALAALFVFGLISPAQTATGQREDGETVRIVARIVDADSNDGLEDAVIQLSGLAARHVTGADGTVAFDAPLGRYDLTVRRSGYATLSGGFRVLRPGDFTLTLRPLDEDEIGGPARLIVRVIDSALGSPVAGAGVTLARGRQAITNADGRVEFRGLDSELAHLTIDRIGYATRTEPVALHPERTTAVEVALTVEAVALQPIRVEVRSRYLENRGYYRRLDQGVVMRLLTRQTIEDRQSHLLSDAFAYIPGLRIDRPTTHRAVLQARDCELAIFVDGIEWNPDIEGSVNIDQIPPHWVEAAEVYWGSRTPPQFWGRNNGGCGSAVIWTRQATRGN